MQRKTLILGAAAAIFLVVVAQNFVARQTSLVNFPELTPSNTAQGLTPFSMAAIENEANFVTAPLKNKVRPEHVSEDDWTMLVESLSLTGQTPTDALSLIDYLIFEQSFKDFLEIDGHDSSDLIVQKAGALLSQLPSRVAKNDITLTEAAFIGNYLLSEMEDDESRRVATLTQFQAQLGHVSPQSSNEEALAEQTRIVDWRRQQAEAFTEWSNRTDPSERTQASLDGLMSQARRP